MAIAALVFDLGGVIFSDGSADLEHALSGDDRARARAVLHSDQAKALRRGRITDAAFWEWAEPRLPSGYTRETFRQAWYDSYRLDPDIWSLVERLHGRYRLGIFSGNIRSRVEYLDEKYDFRRWFDVETYSYDKKMSKPEGAFVDAMIEDVGCSPERIVYLDDRDSCLAPARARGVHTILYVRGAIDSVLARLRSLGVGV